VSVNVSSPRTPFTTTNSISESELPFARPFPHLALQKRILWPLPDQSAPSPVRTPRERPFQLPGYKLYHSVLDQKFMIPHCSALPPPPSLQKRIL